ncbi:MAG: TIGR00725 family protein [candidate division Zixibacteria bacterium]|nr:TIGR00725 family protein [candidate division Zixibacteria bacterium]
MQKSKAFVGVIGAGDCSEEVGKLAEEVGEKIAEAGAILVCGGLGGVMEAASRGAKRKGGITVGVLPGIEKADANPYIDYPIVTGLGEGRNLLVVRNSDVLIAFPGEFGTLSEIAFALKLGKSVVGLSTWNISDEIIRATNAQQAVDIALQAGKNPETEP